MSRLRRALRRWWLVRQYVRANHEAEYLALVIEHARHTLERQINRRDNIRIDLVWLEIGRQPVSHAMAGTRVDGVVRAVSSPKALAIVRPINVRARRMVAKL